MEPERGTDDIELVMKSDDLHLKIDGIKEAVCEIRFTAPQSLEIIVGRLADARSWRDQVQTRLPSADIPAQLRAIDPALRFQPSLEVSAPSGGGFVRIGPSSLSIHQTAPYKGWTVFQPAISDAIHAFREQLPDARIERVGLRYINLLNERDHLITRPHNLKLKILVGDNLPVDDAFAVNYRRMPSAGHICQVGVATREYTAGPAEEPFSVVVDVDVFTPEPLQFSTEGEALSWIEGAHNHLKDEFFSLWPDDILQKLRRDQC